MTRRRKVYVTTGKRKRYSKNEFPIRETSRLLLNDCVRYVENQEIVKSIIDDIINEIVGNESASSRKIQRYLNDIESDPCSDSSDDKDEEWCKSNSYVIIDLQTFQTNLDDIAVCKKCQSPLTIGKQAGVTALAQNSSSRAPTNCATFSQLPSTQHLKVADVSTSTCNYCLLLVFVE